MKLSDKSTVRIDCRICGSKSSKLISEKVSDAPNAKIYQCKNCEMVYLHPIMNLEDESEFYEQEFPTYMEARSAPGGANAAAHFRSYMPEAERRAALVRSFLPPDASVLEVGSSTGYFLHAIQGYVASVTGVEPGRSFAEYAQQNSIPTVDALRDLKGTQYDILLLYYVLEHIRDPVAFLKELQNYLKPGGRLLLEVPNVDDVLLTEYDIPDFGPFYYQKAHYYNFSRTTLEAVIKKAGYQVQIFPAQRYDLSNHMHWMMTGRPGGMGKYSKFLSKALDIAYKESLENHWICDTLFAVATTPSTVI